MSADSGIETDAVDDGLGVEALHLGIGVELIEVADAQGEVGVGKQFYRLRFLHADEKYGNSFGIRMR